MRLLMMFLVISLCTGSTPQAIAQSAVPRDGQSTSSDNKPAPSSRRSGVITGRVIVDDGQPVAEAQIHAVPIGAKMNEFQQTICDDEGVFKLTGLRSGAYIIQATLPGYVPLRSLAELQLHRPGDNVSINLVKGGVITGRVTDAFGESVAGVRVLPQLLRDVEGRRTSPQSAIPGSGMWGRLTDDRGIYRIFGLDPGIYIVSVTGSAAPLFSPGARRREAPTYYPSGGRETAVELTVRSGEEVAGIDIRQRSERGRSISGTLSGELETDAVFNAIVVGLTNTTDGNIEAIAPVIGSKKFALYGVSDGEYEITAHRFNESNERSASTPRRLTVKGADISGIELKLLRLGSITGRVTIESINTTVNCGKEEPALPEEISVRTKHGDKDQITRDLPGLPFDLGEVTDLSVPNEKGEFILKNLESGRHRIIADLPGENWFVRSITQTASVPVKRAAGAQLDIARNGILLKRGETQTGVNIVIATGAASLRGRVVPAKEARSPVRMRVHLIPAEVASADDALRYFETITRNDNSFEFKHLAPGKYLLLARSLPGKEPLEAQYRPVAWDAVERTKLRREAEVTKDVIELQPCQRLNDHVLIIK
jgi:Carboxypeptidase regulatory-like domain